MTTVHRSAPATVAGGDAPATPYRALTRPEWLLLLLFFCAIAVAVFGPFVPQYANYHAFADQRHLAGLPYALDVLSNLPFAVGGLLGLRLVWARAVRAGLDTRWSLAALFFSGLVATAACSAWYHLAPDNAGLLVDRSGMVLAFAGLAGMVVAQYISPRAGVATAGLFLVGGVAAVLTWFGSGNLLPWVVVQGGGMVLIPVLALRKPLPGAWVLPTFSIIALYAVAKLLELGDHTVFDWTGGLVSGHTLKHLFAAAVAWPVLRSMHIMHNAAKTAS